MLKPMRISPVAPLPESRSVRGQKAPGRQLLHLRQSETPSGSKQISPTAPPATDNVWDVDCSSFFPANISGTDIQDAYLGTAKTIELMRQVLRGIDRSVLENAGLTKGNQ